MCEKYHFIIKCEAEEIVILKNTFQNFLSKISLFFLLHRDLGNIRRPDFRRGKSELFRFTAVYLKK